MEIIIDKEFEKLIPPIEYEEFLGLEESIKKEGCRDTLITWNGILLDGHNRYKICTTHKIEFKTKKIEFESRGDAKIWIINNQFGRRNLSPYQRGVLALRLEPLIKEKGKENLRKAGEGLPILAKVDSRKEIARKANISHGTFDKIKEIEKKATPEQKKKLISGDRTVSNVFKDIQQDEIKRGIREIPMPKGNFSIIYADPPWKYEWDNVRGSAAKHYNTENINYLKKIKEELAKKIVLYQ